jgi:hypothetical protein
MASMKIINGISVMAGESGAVGSRKLKEINEAIGING